MFILVNPIGEIGFVLVTAANNLKIDLAASKFRFKGDIKLRSKVHKSKSIKNFIGLKF